MSQQHLNYGTTSNDGTGELLRDAFIKVEANFTELYSTAGLVTTGTGTPTTSPTTGTLFLATDTGYTWGKLPGAIANPTRVQENAAPSTFAVTLPAAPTSGNWLIAICHRGNDGLAMPTPNTAAGWSTVTTHPNPATWQGTQVAIFVKKAGASESATQTASTDTTSSRCGISMIEVAGIGPVFSPAIDLIQFKDASTGFPVTQTRVTPVNNVLAIGVACWWGSAATIGNTLNSGWTNVVTTSAGGANSETIGSQIVATSGTTVTCTVGNGAGWDGLTNVLITLKSNTGQPAGWKQLSYLTTLKSSSGTVTTNPLSLTFGAGLSITDDGYGNSTIVPSGITEAMETLSDVTTNNVSTTRHGYVPKAPNDATKYLDGTGAWSTPAGTGGGGGGTTYVGSMVPIQEVVTSGSQATVTISGIPSTYRDLLVVVSGRGTAAATAVNVGLTLNGDTGANYDWSYLQTNAATTNGAADTAINIVALPGSTAPSGETGYGKFTLFNYANSAFAHVIQGDCSVKTSNTSGNIFSRNGSAYWRTSAAITSLTLSVAGGGGFQDGSVVTIYGIGGSSGSAGVGGATVTVSATPPSSPSAGNLWWKSDEGIMLIYYNDGDTSQWISTNTALVSNQTSQSPDNIPTVPNAADDEFEFGTAIDTTGARRPGSTPWTWVSQGTRTSTVANGSLTLSYTSAGAGDNWGFVTQPTPATPWTYVAKAKWSGSNKNNFVYGAIILYDSVSGKLISFSQENGQISVAYWTNTTTFSSLGTSVAWGTWPAPAYPDRWVYQKIQDNGTNLIFSISHDGITYHQIFSASRTAFLSSYTSIGLGVGTNIAAGSTMNLDVDYFRRIQ